MTVPYHVNPSILIEEKLWNKAKVMATRKGISRNELVERLVRKFTQKEIEV